MKVVAETKFPFRGDKSAVVYTWDDYGLRLHVPEGSTADFRARIVHSTKFVLPKGTELVSPFYWISSKGKATGPVGVEIQRSAEDLVEENYGLEFVVYKMENPELPYVFKEYSGQFSSNWSYGRIDVEFSDRFFAIKKFFGLIPMFLAQLYYCRDQTEAHIVIVPNKAKVSYTYCSCM